MSSQPPKSIDGNWIALQPANTDVEDQANVLLAQLSFLTILLLVMCLLLPSIFDGWFIPPPWRWPEWGKIVGLTGVGLWGCLCIRLVIKLGKRRFNNRRLSRILGPYDVQFTPGSTPDQPLKFRIRQQTRGLADIERLDVSLIYVERIVQVYCDQALSALVRDRELWSNTKTSAFESRLFPAESTIDISTEFAIPEVAEFHRRRDGADDQKPGAGKTDEKLEVTRHLEWRLRIETYLTDGHSTTALYCLPAIVADSARSDAGGVT